MPNYVATPNVVVSLMPGDKGQSFVSGEIPIGPQAGQQFALASMPSFGAQAGREISWQITWIIAPTALTASLQGAMDDTDGEYTDLQTTNSIAINGLLQTTALPQRVRFVRIKITGNTGPGTIRSAKILA